MAERVYGRMPPESLGRALAERVGDCSAFVASASGTEPLQTRQRQAEQTPNNEKPAQSAGRAVPRDRIELPTRGFSNVRPVWPRPRKARGGRAIEEGVAAELQQIAVLRPRFPKTSGTG
jgi:hypothetical protein